jgi:CheY-like chemotaxis protein/Tfp pilus assembly protein PilZ
LTGIHRERDRRLQATCAVEVRHDGGLLLALTEDVARRGMYLRTDKPLTAGTEAAMIVALPERPSVGFIGRVMHVLPPEAARALGRSPGMGVQIEGEVPPGWLAFVESLEAAAQRDERPLAVVILDRSAPLRERLKTNLIAGGFEAHEAADVAAALELCRSQRPDVLLADAKAQGANPVLVLKLLAAESETSDIPVMLMSEDAGDMMRLQAYRRGVRDFIPKPFTDEELMIRLRRVGARTGRRTRHVSLRGVLEDVGVPTVLSLLEFEKRPGILVLAKETQVGRIHVTDGRVKRVELPGTEGSSAALSELLGWRSGSFAFLPGFVPPPHELDEPISGLLLEHARVEDEEEEDDAELGELGAFAEDEGPGSGLGALDLPASGSESGPGEDGTPREP